MDRRFFSFAPQWVRQHRAGSIYAMTESVACNGCATPGGRDRSLGETIEDILVKALDLGMV